MENKLRRGLALLMTLIMLISCAPMDALAAIVPVPGGTQTSEGFALKSIVKPPVATHTYVFMNGTKEFARQILKNGQTLNNPGTPDSGSENKEFTGWRDDAGNAPAFGEAVTVNENDTKTITYHAQFADVYFVFFTNEKGEVMVTKKGANGETISTEGVTYPVGNDQSIIGWNYTGEENDPLISEVKLEGGDVTLKAVVKDGHWITYDSQGGTYVAPAFVKGNGTTTAPAAPTRPGYTFHHWSQDVGGAAFTFGQQLNQALTLYAVWTANTNTRYTVIHWLENADDNEYSYKESETKTGTTGAQTSAEAKTYEGFTKQNIAQQTIAGDGSTIVNVYYKRNVYEVKFYSNSGWFSSPKEYTSLRITAKYGANISDEWPTYNGSNAWSTTDGGSTYQVNIDTMPLNGAKFYGPKTGSGSESAYYYGEVLPGESGVTYNGVTYKLHHTDTSPGTGYSVTKEDKYPITGFTYKEGTANGQSYNNAKFYYTRNSYNIVYVSGGQTVNTVSKKFEESIADAGSYTPTTKPEGKEAYEFGGWYSDPTTTQAYSFTGKTMPAQNVTVYAKWNEPTVNGKAHIKVDGTDEGTTLTATYGEALNAEELNTLQNAIMDDHPGYTWRGWRTGPNGTGDPFNVDTKIYNNITLYPYYTKNGTFTVEYVSGKNDVTAPKDGKSYAEDSFADLMSPGKLVADDGEYFLGWSDGAATYQPRDKYQIKSNHANERNVITLTARWGARPAGTTLTYKANGGVGADEVENLANNATVTTRPGTTFSRVGYTFKGWDTDPKGTGSIAPNTQVQVDNNGANVLYAIWTANTDTKYTVEFYYQNTDGTYTLNHSDERTATTDTEVSVTDTDKAAKENGKYVYDKSANNIESGTVAGDGSLVLKLYFKLNKATYRVEHRFETVDGTSYVEDTNYPDQTLKGTVGQSTNAQAYTVEGFTAQSFEQKEIRADGSTVVRIEYKRNLYRYTVNYLDKDTTEILRTAETVTNVRFGTVIKSADKKIDITGHYYASADPETLTIGTGENVMTLYYTKRTDLSYTVKYLEKDTNTQLANPKTVENVTYGTEIKSSGEVITINGYTYASADPETLKIGTDEEKNVINIYYVKRTDLSYTVNYLEKDTNKVIHDQKVQGNVKFEDVITSANEVITINGYNYDSVDKETLTIGTDEEKNVINIYYVKRTDLSYTVNYLEKDTNKVIHDQKVQGNVEFEDVITSANEVITINGYNYDSVDKETLKIGTDEEKNVINIYYVKRTDLSYTINYYWNHTTDKVAESETVLNQTFDSVIVYGTNGGENVVGPKQIEGYTVVPMPENATITITTGTNEINFYYYKNVKLIANSDNKVYNGEEQNVSGFTGAPEGISFEGVTAGVAGTNKGEYTAVFEDGTIGKVDTTEKKYIVAETEDGKLTISARPVIFTGDSGERVYNGFYQEIVGFTINHPSEEEPDVGLLEGHTYEDITYSAKGKNVDSYEGSFTGTPKFFDENHEEVTENYTVEYASGTLTITAAQAEIEITGPQSRRKYTGELITVKTEKITTESNYEPDPNDSDTIRIKVTGLMGDDYIEEGSVIHIAEGTYVDVHKGRFEWGGLHANQEIPTVRNKNDDGTLNDVTQNYTFKRTVGALEIYSDHPTQPDKEIDDRDHKPGTKYGLGDRIYFKITVRNITLKALTNVQVYDPTAVIVPGDGYRVIDEHNALIESMAASVEGKEPTTVVITAYHVVTEEDIMKVATDDSYKYKNVATITVDGKTIDPEAGTNDIEDPDLTLEIVKKLVNQPAAGNAFKLGETAKFEITVTNLGNVTQRNIPVTEALAGAVFTEGRGYTLNADKTVATIAVLNPATKESQRGDSIVLYAQYTIKEEDLGNKNLKNIVTAPNGKPGEEPIPVDEAKSMAGQKIWNDLDNLYDTRTESVTVNLKRKAGQNGAAEQYKTATVDQSTGWRYGFDHLPAHDMQNNEFFYWVEEAPITGYEPTYEVKDDSHCDIVNNLQTYTLTIHYWQHKLGDTKMEQAFPDYVATLYYKQPYDVESPEREGIILDDMSQARISGTMPAHDLVIDVYYHRIAYRLTIHYIYQDGTMAHEDYTWTYWFNSTYNVPSPIIPGFTPSIDVIAGRMPSHGLELTVVYVGDSEIVIPDEDTSLGFKSYLNAGECFE